MSAPAFRAITVLAITALGLAPAAVRAEDLALCRMGDFTGFRPLGSETCMKVGGFVRMSADTLDPRHSGYRRGNLGYAGEIDAAGTPVRGAGRRLDAMSFTASATMRVDARTSTDHGLLRTYMELRFARGSGSQVAELAKGFVRWGDLVVGRFQSMYDFSANDYNTVGSLGSDTTLMSIAYTRQVARDWFTTIAVEDGDARRMTLSPNFLAPYGATAAGRLAGLAYSPGDAGQRWPDLVANALYDPAPSFAWQLSGALHPVATAKAGRGSAARDETRLGFAIQAGLRWEPAALPPGDAVILQAAYTRGAISYAGVNAGNSGYGNLLPLLGASDGVLTGPQAKLRLTSAWNVVTTAIHVWRPDFDTGVWASATGVDFPSAPLFATVSADFPAGIAARDYRFVQLGAGLRWRPAPAIQISLMGNWYWVAAKRMPTDWVAAPGTSYPGAPRTAQGFQSSLRLQSSF